MVSVLKDNVGVYAFFTSDELLTGNSNIKEAKGKSNNFII